MVAGPVWAGDGLGILDLGCYNGRERENMNQQVAIDGLYRIYFMGSVLAVLMSLLFYYLVSKSKK